MGKIYLQIFPKKIEACISFLEWLSLLKLLRKINRIQKILIFNYLQKKF